jgi:hypothetical protein
MVRSLATLASCALLGACQPVALALIGAGATSTVRYNIEGVASRTFTASASTVKSASLAALDRMGIKLDSASSTETTELIYARAARRDIEIELEPISARATRLRVTAKDDGSIFYDGATALEIVQQTEKLLAAAAMANAATGATAQAAKLVEN